jgi:hypothetical protein
VPQSWIKALSAYNYPVDLSAYKRAGEFPGFFTQEIAGDRGSTIEFEDYFRARSGRLVEPYFEVVFWKLYRMKHARDEGTQRIVDYITKYEVDAADLRSAVKRFVEQPSVPNLSIIRALLGIKTQALAVALTFPAFVDPVRFPMVDRQTAKWVRLNLRAHNDGRRNALTAFQSRDRGLRYDDFDSYLNWVAWCNETAYLLTHRTDVRWRARDVEMAVFAAARQGLSLNPLP